MPKAGKFDYPNIGLDTVIKKLKKAHDDIKTDDTTRDVIAQTLGMSVSGGRFVSLIASLEKYGLIKTGGKKIVITDRGKFAMYGNDAEIEKAKNEAVCSIELFAKLNSRYGKTAKEEQIRAFLLQEANVDISEAPKTAKNVSRIYNNVSKHITSVKQPITTPTQHELGGRGLGRRESKTKPEAETSSELLQIKYGDFYVEATKKEDAKALLLVVAKKLGIDFEKKD